MVVTWINYRFMVYTSTLFKKCNLSESGIKNKGFLFNFFSFYWHMCRKNGKHFIYTLKKPGSDSKQYLIWWRPQGGVPLLL